MTAAADPATQQAQKNVFKIDLYLFLLLSLPVASSFSWRALFFARIRVYKVSSYLGWMNTSDGHHVYRNHRKPQYWAGIRKLPTPAPPVIRVGSLGSTKHGSSFFFPGQILSFFKPKIWEKNLEKKF